MAKFAAGPGGLDMGTGDSGRQKEFLLIGALAVIIVGALVLTIMYNWSSDEDNSPSDTKIMGKCLDPQCAAEFEITLDAMTEDERPMSRVLRFTCPTCGTKRSALIMTRCPVPECRKFFLSDQTIQDHKNDLDMQAGREPAVTHMPPIICPYCETDHDQYMREQRKRRMKGR